MKINKFKTREERLTHKLNQTLLNKTVDGAKITELIQVINDYEKNNLDTISKLKKDKSLETKRISGALRQTINAHGPITLNYIGSATKRIYGVLLSNPNKDKTINIDIGTFIIIQILVLIGALASIVIFR
jgi:hypothetical protein